MKLSKDKGIELIIAELQKGSATLDILGVIRSKTKLAESTFYEWLKIAKERHSVTQEAINKQKIEEYKQSELERLKTQILDRDKILEMQSNLVKLAYNKMIKSKEPTPSDLQAYNSTIERYSKLLGLDAPKQVEQKNIFENLEIVGIKIE